MRPDYSGAEAYILDKLNQKLPKDLSYHGLHHTRDVYDAALVIAKSEKISIEDINLLKIATMFHDAGFMSHYKDHEEVGCKLAAKVLPQFGFDPRSIKVIQGMIMATKIPQNPKTQLERIICDADLDYLGRSDFKRIARTLFDELRIYMSLKDEKVWNKIQLNFLKSHHYYTRYSKKHREAKKQEHLQEIIQIVQSYDKGNGASVNGTSKAAPKTATKAIKTKALKTPVPKKKAIK